MKGYVIIMKMLEKTINAYLEEQFEKYAENRAIVYPEGNISYTYKEMSDRINLLAKGLIANGVKKETHVSLLAPSCPDWIMYYLALTKIGAIPVCLNDKNTQSELEYLLDHSDSYAAIVSTKSVQSLDTSVLFASLEKVIYMETIENVNEKVFDTNRLEEQAASVSDETLKAYQAETRYDDILMFLYTSGTTGRPKAVMSVHNRMLTNILVYLDNFGYTSEDRVLSALPLYHVMGCLFTTMLTFMAGGTSVLISKFKTKDALQIIQDEQCTSFHGVPTMYQYMLNYVKDYDVTSLKKGMIGGAYCAPETMVEIQKGLGVKYLFPAYGQSEGVGFTQVRMTDSNKKRISTVGKAVDGVELKIVDNDGNKLPAGEVGEVVAYMPYRMAGYYKNPEATAETIQDGWIYTGDLGMLDRQGYLTIKGRKKELIIRGGENISPVDIEDVIRTYAMVEDVAVVGVPDKTMGEEICAYIQMKPFAQYVEEEVRAFIAENLPKYKFPKYIKFIDQMPLNASGKILKRELQAMFNEEQGEAKMAR